MMLRLALWLYHHVCRWCGGWIWRPTHRDSHVDCAHRGLDAAYQRNLANYPSIKPWPCPDCGRV
jgi:hypothetical protein